jgi:hypothetical protein
MAVYDQEDPADGGAARCTICALNFPPNFAGSRCPVCESDTLDFAINIKPDDPDELMSAVNHAKFEREYGPADVS